MSAVVRANMRAKDAQISSSASGACVMNCPCKVAVTFTTINSVCADENTLQSCFSTDQEWKHMDLPSIFPVLDMHSASP